MEFMKKYLSQMNKKKVLIGGIIATALLMIAFLTLDLTLKKCCLYLLLSFGTGCMICLPDFEGILGKALACLYLVLVPYKILQRMFITTNAILRWKLGSILFLICLYFLLYAILKHLGKSLFIGTLIWSVVLTVGYFICIPQLSRLGWTSYKELLFSYLYLTFFAVWGLRINPKLNIKRFLFLCPVGLCFIAFLFLNKWNDILPIRIINPVYMTPNTPWYESSRTVIHALGYTPEGDYITNSFESFQQHYGQGQRVFEADIQITSDNEMVLRHDWDSDLGQAQSFGWTEEAKYIPTSEQFLSTPIHGKYTPLSLYDIFTLMNRYKDVYLITDTKYSDQVSEQFTLLVNTAINNHMEEVLDRVVVQIYYPDMYREIMDIYPFKNVIYTIYMIGYQGPEETAGFCQKNNIPVLTMPADYWSASMEKDLKDYDTHVFVHTVNDPEQAELLMNSGVYGIYTDDLINGVIEYPKHLE